MYDEALHELISAYVDDEVSLDERRRAEQLLASDADLRRYYNELLRLRASLEQLPRHKLPADFADRVLQRSEQAAQAIPGIAVAISPARRTGRAWRTRPIVVILASCLSVVFIVTLSYKLWKPSQHDSSLITAQNNHRATTSHAGSDRPVDSSAVNEERGTSAVANTAASGGGSAARNDKQSIPAEHVASVPTDPEHGSNTAAADPSSEQSESALANASNPATLDATVAERDAQQMPLMLMVVEVVLSPRAIGEQTFEAALVRAEIPWQQRVAVDEGLQQSLLANRAFGGLQPDEIDQLPVQPEESPSAESYLELIFVVARGRQIVELNADLELRRLDGEVLGLKYDLAMGSSGSDLAVQLANAAREQAPGIQPHEVRAHPLIIEGEMRARLLSAMHSGNVKERDAARRGVEVLEDDRAGQAGTIEGNALAVDAAADALLAAERMQFPVLYVLRSQDRR